MENEPLHIAFTLTCVFTFLNIQNLHIFYYKFEKEIFPKFINFSTKNVFTKKDVQLVQLLSGKFPYQINMTVPYSLLVTTGASSSLAAPVSATVSSAVSTDVHKYPSSKHMYADWDKLAKQLQEDEKRENLEGDAALNNLFKQIYSDGSDEVKRAMNKSFQESGGTVLSTNWKDIKKEKVEIKPPDCMEYKEYEY